MKIETLVLPTIVLGLIVALALPTEVLASTGDDFGGKAIADQADMIKNVLFGGPMRFAGAAVAAYGMLRAVLVGNRRSAVTYIGIGLAIGILPAFIDKVFPVASMLIP